MYVQQVRTITALALSSLAEAAHPYGIESFDRVLRPLWKGIRTHRGKGLAAFLKAIGFVIPLMDATYANYYTREVMVILIREFQVRGWVDGWMGGWVGGWVDFFLIIMVVRFCSGFCCCWGGRLAAFRFGLFIGGLFCFVHSCIFFCVATRTEDVQIWYWYSLVFSC